MPRAGTALRPVELVVSCEHGGNRVPAAYRRLFPPSVLASHRGYDPGALELARDFARVYRAKLFYSTVTRLLVDLNRSEGHRQSFSRFVPRALKPKVLASHHRPYRAALEAHVRAAIARGRRVVHLSCHSFAPRIRGMRRSVDVGLLYDPRRRNERLFCTAWQSSLQTANPKRVVRLNYPYRGFADGLTTSLRTVFADDDYLGLELEVNQRYPRSGDERWTRLRRALVASFAAPLGALG
jgi:predicted N-formylglutamate amidohydrolase